MPPSLRDVSDQARLLASSDKADLLDELLVQLSEPDAGVHGLWLDEVQRRVAAHRACPTATLSRDEAMDGLFRP